MIEMQRISLPEIVDRAHLEQWRRSLTPPSVAHIPTEVIEFIRAVAGKLPDFERFGVYRTLISGAELMLCGMTEYNGERIRAGMAYPIDVPRMQAVDHQKSMYLLYRKKGKQGLIDYVKAHVEEDKIKRLLEVLNVHVFHQESKTFREVMDQIRKS